MIQSEVLLLCYTRRMQITLTPHAEELLRDALARHPGQSPAQILEEALAERVDRETGAKPAKPHRTREEFDAWVRQFAAYSDKIPSMPGETFSRAMIYQDHN
jgi:hypothetical protein